MAASDQNPIEYLNPDEGSDNALETRVDAATKTGGQRGMSFAWRKAKEPKLKYPPLSPRCGSRPSGGATSLRYWL